MSGPNTTNPLAELHRQRAYSRTNNGPSADQEFDPPYDAMRIHGSVDGDFVFENADGDEQTLPQAMLTSGETFPVEVANIPSGSNGQTLSAVILLGA